MNHYKPKRVRLGRVFASFLRGIAGIISRWPLLLIVAFFISPIGPHMRFEYTYQQYGSQKYMTSCKYIGARGFVWYREGATCPFFTIIDRTKI